MESINIDPSLFMGNTGELSLVSLIINLALSASLGFLLAIFYRKYGSTITNRNHLAKNFVMISVTTTLVITVVKASLALSLGLVGALSIVRFRAAIKEPEELSFLFLAIAIGLGFGAEHRVITIVAFFLILILFYINRAFSMKSAQSDNIFLTISYDKKDDTLFSEVLSKIADIFPFSTLKRYDLSDKESELVFLLNSANIDQIESFKHTFDNPKYNFRYSFVEEARVY